MHVGLQAKTGAVEHRAGLFSLALGLCPVKNIRNAGEPAELVSAATAAVRSALASGSGLKAYVFPLSSFAWLTPSLNETCKRFYSNLVTKALVRQDRRLVL